MTDSDTSEEIEAELTRLAEGLARLSEGGVELPANVEGRAGVPFEAESVDFTSSGWLDRLLEIEPWLYLDKPLVAGESAQNLLRALFAELGGRPDECISQGEDATLALTARGASLLGDRVERAAQLREAYIEALEEGRSRQDATADWSAGWEDATLDAASQRKHFIEGITARVETWKIRSFVGYAQENRLDLNPSYQRDSVWTTPESQVLIESILRGIPLPSIILRFDRPEETEGEDEEEERWQIVDGKQRLTAILRFVGQHPDWRDYVLSTHGEEALKLHDRDFRAYKRKFPIPKANAQFAPFAFAKIGDKNDPLYALTRKYYSDLRDQKIKLGSGGQVKVRTIFEEEGGQTQYLIPVILFTETRVEAIHQVFHRYNKQGRKLNAEELRNATYHHLHLTRLLLALSGDREFAVLRKGFGKIVDKVTDEDISILEGNADYLAGCGGKARFRRTKILSWMLAVMAHQPRMDNGQPATPSTAGHIDAFLDAVSDVPSHAMRDSARLTELMQSIAKTVELHQQNQDAWHPNLRSRKGHEVWEDLPLVATLAATFVIVLLGAEEAFVQKTGSVREMTAPKGRYLPKKTQNVDQWSCIARVVIDTLRCLGVEPNLAIDALTPRGFPGLKALATIAGSLEQARAGGVASA